MKKVVAITLLSMGAFALNAQKSNLQTYTPSALFNNGEWEINAFNSIYTQDEVRNREGESRTIGQRQSFFTSMIQFTTGLSKNARFNAGLDVYVSSARYGQADDSPFRVFSGTYANFSKTVISYIGPRIKFQPLASIPRLSIQSVFLIPVANDLERPNFITHDRYTSWTQFFFDQNVGEDFQLFLEADFLWRINRNSTNERNFFRTPLSAFISYFPTSKTTIFSFVQYSPRFETLSNTVDEQFGLSQWFTQVGGGARYQLTNELGLELSYGNFVASRQDGAGYTMNIGLRYIRK